MTRVARTGQPVRFAALGDSLTSGVSDPVDGGLRGWAALLAGGLAASGEAARFRNFAVSGALTRDVAERQVPQALALAPDIASVLVGVNDTLRRTFDIHDFTVRFDAVCAALTEGGAVLLTACLPDPGTMLGLPAPLARWHADSAPSTPWCTSCPRATPPYTCTSPRAPGLPTAACGARTGCTRASAGTG